MKRSLFLLALALAAFSVSAEGPALGANGGNGLDFFESNNNNNNKPDSLSAFHRIQNYAGAAVAGVFEQLPVATPTRPGWPVVTAGPAGNIARIRLPECFTLDKRNDMDWKYFAGTLRTSTGDDMDIVAGITRTAEPAAAKIPYNELVVGLFRMAHVQDPKNNFMTVNAGFGATTDTNDTVRSVLIPPAQDYEFSLKLQHCDAFKILPPPLNRDGIDMIFEYDPAQLKDGKAAPVGSIGARYRLWAYDHTNNVTVELKMQDLRGTVFQGDSGAVAVDVNVVANTGRGDGSLEFSNPRLLVTGGTVTFSSRGTHQIVGGNIFLDHQLIVYDMGKPNPAPILNGPLYTGSWISMWLDDGRTFTIFTAYNKPAPGHYVVYSGTKFPGTVKRSFGTLWAPWTNETQGFGDNIVIKLRGSDDFQVNPVGAPNIEDIEIYISPVTGKRYATTMEVKIRREWSVTNTGVTKPAEAAGFETLYVKAFQPAAEIGSPSPKDTHNSFYESGAYVYNNIRMSPADMVGYGVLEQIGQN